MLNAVCETKLKSVDYKSIALPAELQGRPIYSQIFSLKDQINQCLKNLAIARSLLAARNLVQHCRSFVPNLSVFLSVSKSAFNQDFINSFNFIKTITTWSGIYENNKINQVYKSQTRFIKTYR